MRRVGLTRGLLARVQPCAGEVVELREHDVDHRDVDLAALALDDLGEQAEPGGEAGGVVDHREAALGRRRIGIAGERHDAGHRLDDVVVGGAVGVRAVEPVAGERDADDLRINLTQHVVGETELPDRARPEIGDERVGARDDPMEIGAAGGGGEIERDALLAAVEAREIGVVRPDAMRADVARDVAFGRLDLDHLGAEIGEHQAAIRPGQHVADLDDANAGERPCAS